MRRLLDRASPRMEVEERWECEEDGGGGKDERRKSGGEQNVMGNGKRKEDA